ncbi:AAA family ATPase [Hydrogenovibrio sp. 3SP14C1]|uniref:AAA family ATPase n=1 Tax=Hydrogenovibrio sp. 3SP14C1 TaxID=3038774 RepID=UPI0024166984|nr:AAA family ATPase [Hydrogenovibrio sp. 3SP14C1]MDG4812297.1 AAA family ATPase [Hydrogenovibrio sp. 3SP14C1]
MNQQINSASMALKHAVYIGQDQDLLEAVRVSVVSKYELEEMNEIPHIWPDDIDLVLMEFDGEVNQTLEQINQILTLSKGVNLYVLLKKKDADFIIEANHQGVQGFIECPNEVFHILSILHMQDRRRKGKNGNVSSFFSLKGGVGCTALATNIASELSDMTENRTVLVDLNMPLGDTSLYLNMEGERLYTLTDFVYNLNRFDENLIYKSLSQHQSGLYLLSLPSEMGELDNLNADLIKTIIQSLRKYFDHVVIDCSSDLSDVTLSCLDESDNIVLVAEPSLSSLRAVNTVIKLTQRLGYLKESLKLIINRDHSNQDEMMEEVIGVMDVDRTVRVYNDYQSFNGSLKEGQLLKAFSPDAKVNQQLNAIANMLHNGSFQIEPVSTQPQKPAFQFIHECQRVLAKLLKKVKPTEAKTA